jgi:hypothetical protein
MTEDQRDLILMAVILAALALIIWAGYPRARPKLESVYLDVTTCASILSLEMRDGRLVRALPCPQQMIHYRSRRSMSL